MLEYVLWMYAQKRLTVRFNPDKQPHIIFVIYGSSAKVFEFENYNDAYRNFMNAVWA